MNPDEALATLPEPWRSSLERQLVQINRNYMEALARLCKVDIRTVYIWVATGRA